MFNSEYSNNFSPRIVNPFSGKSSVIEGSLVNPIELWKFERVCIIKAVLFNNAVSIS
ncbi:unnamed protein product, partial [marine sediment metagenome]